MSDITHTDFQLGNFLPHQLAVASDAIGNRVAEVYQREFDLKIPEWRILAVLGAHQSLRQRDIIGLTFLDKVAVNRACKTLEERGLVRRAPHSNDGRSHLLELTDHGKNVYAMVTARAVAIENRLRKALGFSREDTMRAILDVLIDRAVEIDRVA